MALPGGLDPLGALSFCYVYRQLVLWGIFGTQIDPWRSMERDDNIRVESIPNSTTQPRTSEPCTLPPWAWLLPQLFTVSSEPACLYGTVGHCSEAEILWKQLHGHLPASFLVPPPPASLYLPRNGAFCCCSCLGTESQRACDWPWSLYVAKPAPAHGHIPFM